MLEIRNRHCCAPSFYQTESECIDAEHCEGCRTLLALNMRIARKMARRDVLEQEVARENEEIVDLLRIRRTLGFIRVDETK